MTMRTTIAALCLLTSLASVSPSTDAEVAKKWRIGVDLGGYSPQNEIPSDSANVLSLFSTEGEIQLLFIDPRPDAARFGTLGVRPGPIMRLSAQYAVSRIFIVEGSLGYSRTDVGDVEVHAQFTLPQDLDTIGFAFETHQIPAGEAAIVPLQLTALARFRPGHNFNPYVGGGVGYQWIGFEPSDEFDRLSVNLDRSLGGQTRMSPGIPVGDPNPNIQVSPNLVSLELDGATVDLADSFTWHIAVGAELAVAKRWALTVDLRYIWSSREATFGFNGGEDLGVSVPQAQDFVGSRAQNTIYGPVLITFGGLLDGGSRVPLPWADPATDCALMPFDCFYDHDSKDGIPDTGFYYINGGTIDYESFQFTFGARYTF